MLSRWAQESCDRRDDPESGARIIQLTSAATVSNNIYGEQPYCSPDGNRLVITRCNDFCFDEEYSLLVHELSTLRITQVVRKSLSVPGVFNNAWSGLNYYWTPDRRLMRLSLMTLETEEVYFEDNHGAGLIGSSVSPNQRHIIGSDVRLEGPGAPVFQIVRLDLKEMKREVIFEHPEISNPHLQYNPIDGEHILVQHNKGQRLTTDGTLESSAQVDAGSMLFVIDKDGGNLQPLPVGAPYTSAITGHECFVADTGRVLFTTISDAKSEYQLDLDSRYPQGNIFTALPGDEQPTVFFAPEHRFNHVSVSRCGKYFVADSFIHGGIFMNGELDSVALVIGNLQTGKYRTLVQNTQASGGGNQCTHTHPYMTTDNKHVIYNADPFYSTPQVFAARIPEGFLDSLN